MCEHCINKRGFQIEKIFILLQNREEGKLLASVCVTLVQKSYVAATSIIFDFLSSLIPASLVFKQFFFKTLEKNFQNSNIIAFNFLILTFITPVLFLPGQAACIKNYFFKKAVF